MFSNSPGSAEVGPLVKTHLGMQIRDQRATEGYGLKRLRSLAQV
jgi:hypothetical protein